MKPTIVNIPWLVLVALVSCALAVIGIQRLEINTDVLKSLPADERVISDALTIFANHPIHDQIAIDIAIDVDQPDILVASGQFLQAKMAASGLFAETTMAQIGTIIPELSGQIVDDLPLLFSASELADQIAPRLSREAIRLRLKGLLDSMGGLEGIGQAAFIGPDPLGLKDLVLARLIDLAPTTKATFSQGQLLSSDGRHLLLTARPKAGGSDTAAARRLANLLTEAAEELAARYQPAGVNLTLTPVGAYRAALDNEEIIRHDVGLALGLSTAGIALLLLLSFPRPLFGLLSLVPSLAGTAAALFVYSLCHSSISIMVLGFGGALLAVTVDHGIAYLQFLDRPEPTRGGQAARDVRSVGSFMALITTVGAFLVLGLSDFPIFTELGQFTALGFLFTYLFIHFIFPRIIPKMPAAARRTPPLQILAGRLFKAGKPGAVVAAGLALVLLFFAKPEFRIDLAAMNTVSATTQAADQLFTRVWGNIGTKVYLMTTATSSAALQQSNDRLLAQLDEDRRLGRIESVFVPSMVFPGPERSSSNLAAWRQFWTAARVAQVSDDLITTGLELGFNPSAFAPFLAQLSPSTARESSPLPAQYHQLLAITPQAADRVIQFTTIVPGKNYDAVRFHDDYGPLGQIFDGTFFSQRLAEILFATFARMLLIIAAMVALLVILQLLNWRLTCITLLPLLFAYICTLGTLKLIGHPLDIPGLMLSVVILGMGVDYAIYTVCAAQRFGTIDHPSHLLVRSTIFLAGTSSLIGFGVLCFAEHSLLRSVGITSVCGIGYSLLGTFLLLPPLLKAYFRDSKQDLQPAPLAQRILRRYRRLEAYPRMFARGKLAFDPLFRDLPGLLALHPAIGRIIDIGCGYGLPACWCLESFAAVNIIGIDPDPERIRVAAMATGDRATMLLGAAPDLPPIADPVDVVLLLDMIHYLDPAQLRATLIRCAGLLGPGGILIARCVTRPTARPSLSWYFEDYRARLTGMTTWYRPPEEMSALLTSCGFHKVTARATTNSELFWLVGHGSR